MFWFGFGVGEGAINHHPRVAFSSCCPASTARQSSGTMMTEPRRLPASTAGTKPLAEWFKMCMAQSRNDGRQGNDRTPFPPPWIIDEHPGSFIVRDATGRALAHFYFDAENHRSIAEQLSKNEARAMAFEFRCGLAGKLDTENDAAPEVMCPKCKAIVRDERILLDSGAGRCHKIFDCRCGNRIWIPSPQQPQPAPVSV